MNYCSVWANLAVVARYHIRTRLWQAHHPTAAPYSTDWQRSPQAARRWPCLAVPVTATPHQCLLEWGPWAGRVFSAPWGSTWSSTNATLMKRVKKFAACLWSRICFASGAQTSPCAAAAEGFPGLGTSSFIQCKPWKQLWRSWCCPGAEPPAHHQGMYQTPAALPPSFHFRLGKLGILIQPRFDLSRGLSPKRTQKLITVLANLQFSPNMTIHLPQTSSSG